MSMQPQFSQITVVSFIPFLDNMLLQKGQAFTNYTSQLFYQPDPQLGPGLVAYASPFKQWVFDSGVSGASIYDTVQTSIGPISRGQSGMMIDYNNGRVIFNSAVGTNLTVSGTYAFKDLNVYVPNQTQERTIFSNHYYLNSRFNNQATGAVPAYSFVTPAIFVTDANENNPPWALGGLYNTTFTISLNVLAENQTQLKGALSLIADLKDTAFPQLPISAWPLNEYGDYKGGSGYNYQTIIAQYGNPGNLYMIDNVKTTVVSDYAKIDEAMWLGIADCTVRRVRTIH